MLRSLRFTHKVMLAASLVVVLVLGAFTLSNFLQMRSQVQQDLRKQLQALSESVSQNIADWLNAKMAIIDATAKVVDMDGPQAQILQRVQQSKLAGEFKNVYVGLPDGTFILDDPSIDLPADYDARQRPWYQLAASQGSATFTEPYVDVTTNELTISAVLPVYQQQRLNGVVGGDIMLDNIAAIVKNIDFMGLGYAFLVNADGKILSHPNAQLVDKSITQHLGQQADIASAFTSYVIDGDDYLVSFVPVKGIAGVNWHLAVAVSEQKAFARVAEFGWMALLFMGLGVVVVIVLFSVLLRSLLKPLQRLTHAVTDLASGEGDLTQRLPVESDDEFGQLSAQVNRFIAKIQQAIGDVAKAARQVDSNVNSMVSLSDQTLSMYDQQGARTNNVATAVNQLNVSSQEIAGNAANASQQATQAAEHAKQSRHSLSGNIDAINRLSAQMQRSSEAIAELNENTRNIEQILEVIKGVSEQTNLLALNAAIEAARAGEAGRGFAVVADEVRGLAQRTQQSAGEIETMIDKLQDGTKTVVTVINESQNISEQCVAAAHSSGEQMRSVDDAIAEIDAVNHSVAAATEQQNTVIKSLDEDILAISEDNQRGIQNLQQTRDACHTLRNECERLERLVSRFKVS
ncbi:methyl-accepting chemotaxis protein [Idiomarina xiamenensis]|uniref:Methyl-accepting chemotaxis protein n=1 Tax=Idiomarina xiamenensis 10-D-4 TaxID=740709 RepID=K2KA75_9GAMM|nr:methyl-accepting chemotaxis protein [Idiomarina xiamenensis]EKE83447.1 methyl-accepting chemotaxis protein [Idiomarina xiamenensis 10-D-4]